MRRLEFTCDGCNFVKQFDLPSEGKGDFIPDGWVAHHLVAHENGVRAYEIVADLCPECSNKFRHAVNPANWPKMDAAVRQFAKR
jgi:hypothetical protein